MPLNFEQKTEIKLKKAPLDEVICQVKFSPILSISRDVPIEFQEMVRQRFPKYEAIQNFVLQVPGIGSTEKAAFEVPPKSHNFKTGDGENFISLAPDFFALSAKNYTHWSDFLTNLEVVENAAVKVYQLANATRIGLRFINRFTNKNTGCNSARELLSLFRDELTCLIQAEPWTEISEMFTQLVVPDGKAKLAIRAGFGKQGREIFFVLDFDYFEDGSDLPLLKFIDRINRYHSRIYDAFRWCIKDESLSRFEPVLE